MKQPPGPQRSGGDGYDDGGFLLWWEAYFFPGILIMDKV
jgi:hypothetical protein